MVHLRIVAPPARTERVLGVLESSVAVCNIIVLRGAAYKPAGDVVLCDVAREEASVILEDLRRLGIHHEGSVAVEEVEQRTSETATISASFLTFIAGTLTLGVQRWLYGRRRARHLRSMPPGRVAP